MQCVSSSLTISGTVAGDYCGLMMFFTETSETESSSKKKKKKKEEAQQHARFLTGRQVAWMIFNHVKIIDTDGTGVDLSDPLECPARG